MHEALPNFAEKLPNGRPFLNSLHLTPERLHSRVKVAISTSGLRALLYLVVATLPFDRQFYINTYPDIADAHRTGEIPDLHQHFIHHGYFEGRLGVRPDIDEAFYQEMYPDVASAILNRELQSPLDHYLKAGAIEGRFANRTEIQAWDWWSHIVNADETAAGTQPASPQNL